MGLHDVLDRVDTANGDQGRVLGDGAQEVLQDCWRQIGCLAGVGGEPDPPRNEVDGVEVGDGPLVGQHAGKAHGAVDPGGVQRILQGRSSDELERGVHATGKDLVDCGRDVAVVDQHVVDTVGGEYLSLAVAARSGQDRETGPLAKHCRSQANGRAAPADE